MLASTGFVLVGIVLVGIVLVGIALVNYDLFTIIGLFMATVVATSALVLLVQKMRAILAVLYGIGGFFYILIPDATRERVIGLLNSSYLTPVSAMACWEWQFCMRA